MLKNKESKGHPVLLDVHLKPHSSFIGCMLYFSYHTQTVIITVVILILSRPDLVTDLYTHPVFDILLSHHEI